jgi:hypothetical protein
MHRLWGRGVGLAFVVPMAAFWLKGWIKPQYKKAMLGFGALIGFQVRVVTRGDNACMLYYPSNTVIRIALCNQW